MSRGYQRADALVRLILQRAQKQRESSVSRCRQIVDNWNKVVEEKDLRKEIPGQLDLQDSHEER